MARSIPLPPAAEPTIHPFRLQNLALLPCSRRRYPTSPTTATSSQPVKLHDLILYFLASTVVFTASFLHSARQLYTILPIPPRLADPAQSLSRPSPFSLRLHRQAPYSSFRNTKAHLRRSDRLPRRSAEGLPIPGITTTRSLPFRDSLVTSQHGLFI